MSASISNVRLALSSKADVERGLFGYVAFRLGQVEVDGVTLRRTRGGELTLSYPARRDRLGRDHPYVRPLDDATRREIEAQVFDALEAPAVSSRPRRPVSRDVGTSLAVADSGATRRYRRDVAGMSPEARLAELGGLLAVGYRRLRVPRNALAESAEPEALCDQAVDGNGAGSAEEA